MSLVKGYKKISEINNNLSYDNLKNSKLLINNGSNNSLINYYGSGSLLEYIDKDLNISQNNTTINNLIYQLSGTFNDTMFDISGVLDVALKQNNKDIISLITSNLSAYPNKIYVDSIINNSINALSGYVTTEFFALDTKFNAKITAIRKSKLFWSSFATEEEAIEASKADNKLLAIVFEDGTVITNKDDDIN